MWPETHFVHTEIALAANIELVYNCHDVKNSKTMVSNWSQKKNSHKSRRGGREREGGTDLMKEEYMSNSTRTKELENVGSYYNKTSFDYGMVWTRRNGTEFCCLLYGDYYKTQRVIYKHFEC